VTAAVKTTREWKSKGMKECWIDRYAASYEVYWRAKYPDMYVVPRPNNQAWLVFQEHLWDHGYCRRCGQKENREQT
jgi:hypothetical protein